MPDLVVVIMAFLDRSTVLRPALEKYLACIEDPAKCPSWGPREP